MSSNWIEHEPAYAIKFITTTDDFLIGGASHAALLLESTGADYFPDHTIAIGTIMVSGNEIVGIDFDYGDLTGKAETLEHLTQWAEQHQLIMSPQAIDSTRIAGSMDGWNVAFVYQDGELHYGMNHPAILDGVMNNWEDHMTNPPVFGRVYKEDGIFKAELYSDFYQDDQTSDTKQIDEALAAIRKKYPITELTYGPSSDIIEEMSEYFDDPRMAAVERFM